MGSPIPPELWVVKRGDPAVSTSGTVAIYSIRSPEKPRVRFKVYQLRRRGRRLPWRSVVNGPSFVGDLRTHVIVRGGPYTVMSLHSPETSMGEDMIPPLYQLVLTGMGPLVFHIRGFERIEDENGGSYTVIQEWHCEMP